MPFQISSVVAFGFANQSFFGVMLCVNRECNLREKTKSKFWGLSLVSGDRHFVHGISVNLCYLFWAFFFCVGCKGKSII